MASFLSTAAAAVMADDGFVAFVAEFQRALATATPASFIATPLLATATLAATFAAGCWIGNIATMYWSWVDRLWSLAPPAYAVIFSAFLLIDAQSGLGLPGDARVHIVTALVCAWGLRLTLNFARKGGYGHEEDYRWPILRAFFQKFGLVGFLGRELFNLTFVAIYQHFLIWLFTVLPLYAVWRGRAVPVGPVDYAVAAIFVGLLAVETIADEQQWAFQSAKYAVINGAKAKAAAQGASPAATEAAVKAALQTAGGDAALGFLTHGLFRYSRHPNFWAEQSMWWCLAAFAAPASSAAVAAGAALPATWTWLWFASGAALLTSLFQGSTWMTELLTSQKYPAYAAYQRTTSRLLPWLPGADLVSSEEGRALVAAALKDSAASKKQQ